MLDNLGRWLAQRGFPDAFLEPSGEILILHLSAQNRSRLFAEAELRRQIVAQARAIGFSRVALELPEEDNSPRRKE